MHVGAPVGTGCCTAEFGRPQKDSDSPPHVGITDETWSVLRMMGAEIPISPDVHTIPFARLAWVLRHDIVWFRLKERL